MKPSSETCVKRFVAPLIMVLPPSSGETRLSVSGQSRSNSVVPLPSPSSTGEREANVPVLPECNVIPGSICHPVTADDASSTCNRRGREMERDSGATSSLNDDDDEEEKLLINEALNAISSLGLNKSSSYESRGVTEIAGTLAGRFDRACLLHELRQNAAGPLFLTGFSSYDGTLNGTPVGDGKDRSLVGSPGFLGRPDDRSTSHSAWCERRPRTKIADPGVESRGNSEENSMENSSGNSSGISLTDVTEDLVETPELSALSSSADVKSNAATVQTVSLSNVNTLSPSAAVTMREVPDVEDTREDSKKTKGSDDAKISDDVGFGDFDVYDVETTMPYMNLDYLEEQLQKAIEREEQSQSQRTDREKIRQKLAMGLDEDSFGGTTRSDRLFKKPSLQMRLHGAKSLQVCFVNEASESGEQNADHSEHTQNQLLHSSMSSSLSLTSLGSSKTSVHSTLALVMPTSVSSDLEELDFFTKQARLQAEARLALAQVRPMAHMQLQLEKQLRRKSPIADIMGIPGFGDSKHFRLTQLILQRMNVGQLLVVINDIHAQIESHNIELMQLLMERDDQHMAQDSMLVDIEDLTRRAQEYDIRLKMKSDSGPF